MGVFEKILPPKQWLRWVIFASGIFMGLGLFIMYESNVLSYLGDDPETCTNCHVMIPEYKSWENSSHGQFTTCNDCHVPHDNLIRKYAFKAKDGLYHATIFTLRQEPEVIRMHETGQKVVMENCIHCHQDQITDAKTSSWVSNHNQDRTDRKCWDCHREVPHGRVKSLSSSGYNIEAMKTNQRMKEILPSWMKKQLSKD